jgi:hypothetical protein
MIDAALATLGESPLAEFMAASRVIYPLVNATHILALATLFGSILLLDLRLLGLFANLPMQPLATSVPRLAAAGLMLAVVTGFLLFTVEPLDYVANPAFLTKVTLVALGSAHALSVHMSSAWRKLRRGQRAPGLRLRLSALLSLLLWTGAILAGRWIAF